MTEIFNKKELRERRQMLRRGISQERAVTADPQTVEELV